MSHRALINGTVYNISGGRTLVGGTGYNINKGKTLVGGTAYGIEFGPYYQNFSSNTWEQIISACKNNKVPNTWVVGNQKAMTINGQNYLIDIIGKNHDTYSDGSGTAPLTFQFHDCYATAYSMNSSNTNSGGWGSSLMRNTHLPSILALMPSTVRTAIKNVNKQTSAGSESSAINTTADGLFLLSEIEVSGTTTYSFAGEGTRYEYYSAGNSRSKTRSGSSEDWWQRSPRYNIDTYFSAITSSGAQSARVASWERGVAPAFCF